VARLPDGRSNGRAHRVVRPDFWDSATTATLERRDEGRQHYHTGDGLAMRALGRVPQVGDVFRGFYRFEIMVWTSTSSIAC
jgi:hypothetical protein